MTEQTVAALQLALTLEGKQVSKESLALAQKVLDGSLTYEEAHQALRRKWDVKPKANFSGPCLDHNWISIYKGDPARLICTFCRETKRKD